MTHVHGCGSKNNMGNLPGFIKAEKDQEIRNAIFNTLTRDAGEYLTICEQLRFIYDDVLEIENPELRNRITNKLIDAFNMGKKMNARLARYKRETGSVTGSAGANLIKLQFTQERKEIRQTRHSL